MAVPSREVLLASVLRNLSRRETPMRYITVQRLKTFLFKLSDAQYEEFVRRTIAFDPTKIDPEVKAKILTDIAATDDTGVFSAMAESVFENPDLLNEGKKILTELAT